MKAPFQASLFILLFSFANYANAAEFLGTVISTETEKENIRIAVKGKNLESTGYTVQIGDSTILQGFDSSEILRNGHSVRVEGTMDPHGKTIKASMIQLLTGEAGVKSAAYHLGSDGEGMFETAGLPGEPGYGIGTDAASRNELRGKR